MNNTYYFYFCKIENRGNAVIVYHRQNKMVFLDDDDNFIFLLNDKYLRFSDFVLYDISDIPVIILCTYRYYILYRYQAVY